MSVHVAVRTCVGCSERAPQPGLFRFTAANGRLLVQQTRAAIGRSAYLHRSSACWETFLRRRGAIRSLRTTPDRGERERLVAALRAGEV